MYILTPELLANKKTVVFVWNQEYQLIKLPYTRRKRTSTRKKNNTGTIRTTTAAAKRNKTNI